MINETNQQINLANVKAWPEKRITNLNDAKEIVCSVIEENSVAFADFVGMAQFSNSACKYLCAKVWHASGFS